MNSIQYNITNGNFEYMGRYSDFTPETTRKFQSSRKEKTAICHRISFSLMCTGFINALNFYTSNLENVIPNDYDGLIRETSFYIICEILAITGKHMEIFFDININDIDKLAYNIKDIYINLDDPYITEYKNYISTLFEILEAGFNGEMEFKRSMFAIEAIINRILDNLNNEEFNLHIGQASWNSSIGDAMDPSEPATKVNNGESFILGDIDSKVITLFKRGTKGGGEYFNESSLFIYVAANDDGPFIYQSCSEKPLESIQVLEVADVPIYYHDYLSKEESVNFQDI